MISVSFSPELCVANLRFDGEDELVRRETRVPGSDLSDLPDDIKADIKKEWTPEVVATYRAMLAASEAAEPTQAEIDEEQTRLIEQQGSIIRALATALFNVGNDVRVLRGQKPVTQAQFRDYIKGLLR